MKNSKPDTQKQTNRQKHEHTHTLTEKQNWLTLIDEWTRGSLAV